MQHGPWSSIVRVHFALSKRVFMNSRADPTQRVAGSSMLLQSANAGGMGARHNEVARLASLFHELTLLLVAKLQRLDRMSIIEREKRCETTGAHACLHVCMHMRHHVCMMSPCRALFLASLNPGMYLEPMATALDSKFAGRQGSLPGLQCLTCCGRA